MQVSVPGIKKNPAPYREQTFTYSTALALTGRSAACAPVMAMRPAAEPRTRLLIIFISLNLQVVLSGQRHRIPRGVFIPQGQAPLNDRSVVSRLRIPPASARDLSELPSGTIQDPQPSFMNMHA